MKSVSPAFSTAIAASKRWPKAKVDILWTDAFVNSGMVVESTDYARSAETTGTLKFSWHDPQLVDTVKATPHKYLILDGSSVCDGTFFCAPDTAELAALNQFGWYSESIGDEFGDFETSPSATVVFQIHGQSG
jgi:hypothetical protein